MKFCLKRSLHKHVTISDGLYIVNVIYDNIFVEFFSNINFEFQLLLHMMFISK